MSRNRNAVSFILLAGALQPLVAAESSTQVLSPIVSRADTEEQSPYRIGGDVQIITRQEIEARQYSSLTEAIARLPGVQISSPGYRGFEFGTTFGTEVTLNGDAGVVITVDGRRIDSDASSFGGGRSKSRVSLDVVTDINNVERIEVIKGMGAIAYGSEATGGIINVVTRRGGTTHQTNAKVQLGSWGKQDYSLTHSGPMFDDSLRYFFSARYEKGDDTRYVDDDTGRTATYLNTGYEDKAASLGVEKDFGSEQNLRLTYSWTDGIGYYPITAPDTNTRFLLETSQLACCVSTAPGYRNWFLYDAELGSFNETRSSDVDLVYTFDRDAESLSSFVRAYRNFRRYYTRDYADLFGLQRNEITPADIAFAKEELGTRRNEIVNGGELQLAHQFGRHSLMAGVNYSDSEFRQRNLAQNTGSSVQRDKWTSFLQDRIAVTDRWDVSPGLTYSRYGTITRTTTANVVTTRAGSSKTTFGLQSNYRFDLIGEVYAFWGQIYRPVSNFDFDSNPLEVLDPEKGDNWSVGVRKSVGEGTFLSANYSNIDMSNAIARYSVFDTVSRTFVNRSVNATRNVKSFNATAEHRFDENWNVSFSYTATTEGFAAKNFATNPNDTTNINALINLFRPKNAYQADVTYDSGRWSANVATQYYTGNDGRYFSDHRFLIFGLTANYNLFDNTRLFLKVENLGDENWENKAHPAYGPGAFPQPGRNFTLGVNQKF